MNNNIGPTIREQAHWIDDYSHVDILLKPTNIIWRAIMCIKKLTLHCAHLSIRVDT